MTIMDKEDELLVKGKKTKKSQKRKKKKVVEPKKTKENKSKKKKSNLKYKIFSFLLIVLSVITFITITYEELFTLYYLIPLGLVSFGIVFFLSFILNRSKLKRWIKNIFLVITILLIIFELLMIFFGTKTLKFISSLTDTGYRVETFGIYLKDSSDYYKLKDLNNTDFGYLDTDDSKTLKESLTKIRKNINFREHSYKTTNELVKKLMDNEIDAVVMEVSYEAILEEEQKASYDQMRLIETIDIVDIVDTIKSDVNITKNSFVVYISGIDTSGNIASKARSGVNILLGVNPNTKNILLVNTPRDYYLTLATKKKKDKLTHAGLYGIEESLLTLSDFYDTDIDYYVRINFSSFVKIIDTLDGISVNVPINFCEQNSKRSKKPGDLICLKKGVQTLDGEEALALVRHRKTLPTGDRGRGENQMLVLKAILNKAMSPKIVTKYSSLIDALKGRVITNMKTSEMVQFAKKQLGDNGAWKFTTLSATGSDSSGICYATGSGRAYVMEPDTESVAKIEEAFDRLFAGEQEILVN